MYRCTECHTEYQECPDYCECGNDTFEEIIEDEQEEEYSSERGVAYDFGEELIPPTAPPARKKRKMTNEEAIEYFENKKEKQKSLVALIVIIILCFVVLFVLPPHKKAKSDIVKQRVAKENVKIPSVDTYWDNTLPSAFKEKDPLVNLPILNERFRTISPVLRDYLSEIGKEFNRKWDKTMISSKERKLYTTRVVFTVDKEGIINVKRIIKRSYNDSLDNSVSLALTNTSSVEVPPDDYKGERIYIDFNYNERGEAFIQYPHSGR